MAVPTNQANAQKWAAVQQTVSPPPSAPTSPSLASIVSGGGQGLANVANTARQAQSQGLNLTANQAIQGSQLTPQISAPTVAPPPTQAQGYNSPTFGGLSTADFVSKNTNARDQINQSRDYLSGNTQQRPEFMKTGADFANAYPKSQDYLNPFSNFGLQYGIPIGPNGYGDYTNASPGVRAAAGLPQSGSENGVRFYINPSTGQKVYDQQDQETQAMQNAMEGRRKAELAKQGYQFDAQGNPIQMAPGYSPSNYMGQAGNQFITNPQGQIIRREDFDKTIPGVMYQAQGQGFSPQVRSNAEAALGISGQADKPAGYFANKAANTPGTDIKPTIERNLRAQTEISTGGLFPTTGNTFYPDTQTGVQAVNAFAGVAGKVDKSFNSDLGAYNLSYSPADKFKGQGKEVPKQLNDFIKENAKTLGLGALDAKDGGDWAAALHGEWKSETEAANAAKKIEATIASSAPNTSDLRRLDFKAKLKNGKWVIAATGSTTTSQLSFTEKKAPAGQQTPTDKVTDQVLNQNDQLAALMKFFSEQTQNAAQQRGNSYKLAQEQLANSIQGINAGSESQRSNLMNSLMVPARQGLDELNRGARLNTRNIGENLLQHGFGSSNLGYVDSSGNLQGPAFEEGVTHPYDRGLYDLGNTLTQNLFSGENQIQQNSIQKLQALAGISGPEFPSNVPKLEQLQPGTFSPKITPADMMALVKTFAADRPIADQQLIANIAQSVLNNAGAVTAPGTGSQLLTAGSNVASAFVGKGK